MPLSEDHALLTDLRERLLSLGRPSAVPGDSLQAPPEEIERIAPFAELMFLIMQADGRRDDREKATLLGAFRALTGGRFSSGLLDELVRGFELALEHEGVDGRLEAICSAFASDRQDAEGAYSLAAAMSLADGELEAQEEALLDQVAQWLRLGSDRASALLRIARDREQESG